jgi:UDPglucose--hexose-1-phosphate uridylyltransferase
MSKIRFEISGTNLTLLNPFRDFSEEVHTVEVRRDPLLGDISVYNPYLKDKVKFFFGDCDSGLVEKLIEDSAKNCIFCGDMVEKSTPRYPSKLVPEGRIRIGEALLFPNLFPIGKYHSVIRLSNAHFLKLSEFRPAIIENGLKAAQTFINLVYAHDPSASFVAVNANYLFPAGATLVHPHLQMLITPCAYSYHERLIRASHSYYQEHGSKFYMDLIEEEKRLGDRYVAQRGAWHWLAAFSPMGNNEVMAIHESENDFGVLSERDLATLAEGISRVLSCYESYGHLSFNYSIFAGRDASSQNGFPCLLKIISRQNLYPNYRNDDYFLQKLLHSELIIKPPEDLALELRGFFE